MLIFDEIYRNIIISSWGYLGFKGQFMLELECPFSFKIYGLLKFQGLPSIGYLVKNIFMLYLVRDRRWEEKEEIKTFNLKRVLLFARLNK